MQKIIVLAVLVAFAAAVPIKLTTATADEDVLWARFKTTYKRAFFDSRDESFRKLVFINNFRKISKHNEEQANGLHTYTMAMNEFGDMTSEEFYGKMLGLSAARSSFINAKATANLSGVVAADEIDWTTKGAVTPVKNQGQCGSCWSFSATGAIEGAWFNAKGQLVSLSEQQLMDCSTPEGNHSCNGGLMDAAFNFVIRNKGICSEADYPYTARDSFTCKKCTPSATISSYVDVPQTENDLKKAVTLQPVAVAIEADQEAFQFYSSGVLTAACGTQLNHGVLAVGYGTLQGTDYWKLKNSWGGSWGDNGYILIQRGKAQRGGQCGVLLMSSYPVV